MLSFLIALFLALVPALLTWWILKTYFPTLAEWLRVAIIAAIILGALRLFHSVTCEFLCGRMIP
jgi:hypothetical protein